MSGGVRRLGGCLSCEGISYNQAFVYGLAGITRMLRVVSLDNASWERGEGCKTAEGGMFQVRVGAIVIPKYNFHSVNNSI